MITFTNPIGLLGLLALPAILALHFFRSERRELILGGVHLWDFTKKRQPVGRRRRRIEATVPLFLELLAALLATMLLAGLDVPWNAVTRHYVAVVDGGASMSGVNAGGSTSPAIEIQQELEDLMTEKTRWTIVEAGLEPRILAGPNAEPRVAQEALAGWSPDAPAADLPRAIALAYKFAQATQPVIVMTDQLPESQQNADALRTPQIALGDPVANNAIIFADRYRLESDGSGPKDRIFLVLERLASPAAADANKEVALAIEVDGQRIAGQRPLLVSGETKRLEMDVSQVDRPVVVRLESDALSLDNTVILAPVVGREQSAFMRLDEAGSRAVAKAVDAAPGCRAAGMADEATILFEQGADWATREFAETVAAAHPRARAIVLFPETDAESDVRLADREIVPIGRDPERLLEGVGFEGVLWTHIPFVESFQKAAAGTTETLDLATPILTHKREPLITRHVTASGQLVVGVNLAFNVGNMERTPTWPLLIFNLIEAARARVPGPRQSNVRVGESVDVRAGQYANRAWRLESLIGSNADAEPEIVREFETLPPRLVELPANYYSLKAQTTREDREGLAALLPEYAFAVNFMSRDESDLTSRGRTNESFNRRLWRNAGAAESLRTTRGRLAYYALFALLLATLAGLWIWQEKRQ